MIFNESGYSNLTNVTQILTVANNFTNGFLGIGLWIMISLGSLFILNNFNSKESLVAASFISFISAVFLVYLGLLEGELAIFALVMFVVSLILSITSKGSPIEA